MGIMDLSAELGFHKSTTHRLVTSLQYMGYIRQDEESLKYALSLKFLEIGSKILEQTNMASLIHPSLKKLSEQTGETVHLVRREGTEAVYIDKVESTVSSIRMVSRVGSRIPLYCSGVGKAIMATLPDEEVKKIWNESIIEKKTDKTITDFSQMQEVLEEVRQNGYALDDEENEKGVRCIAACLHGYQKEVKYAFSISGPTSRMTRERVKELAVDVKKVQEELSRELGYYKS